MIPTKPKTLSASGVRLKVYRRAEKNTLFAVVCACNSRSPEGLGISSERGVDMVETYYKVIVIDGLQITPKVQSVIGPRGLTSRFCATVFGIFSGSNSELLTVLQ
jgi:hypothetical protein